MWLIPSIFSPSAQASECSNAASAPPLNTSGTDREFWASSSGTPTRRASLWPGWKKRPWSLRLFGAATSKTWTPEICGDTLTSSRRDSPVSRGPRPASSKEPTMNAGSGRLSFGSSWTWSPSTCSWKTSQGSFLEEDSSTSCLTLPKSGSMRNGVICRRPPLALATDASECSSWPTPAGTEGDKQPHARREGDRTLTSEADHWATPVASDDKRGTSPYSEAEINRPGGCPSALAKDVAEYWATPAARDYRSPNSLPYSERGGGSKGEQLQNQVEHIFSPQGQNPPGGRKSSRSSCRRLNPAFVCWLMGWPWFWTRPEPISFAAREMVVFRRKLARRLSALCGDLKSLDSPAPEA